MIAGQYQLIHMKHIPDGKVHGANMGPIWGRQDPGEPHVGPMNFAIWETIKYDHSVRVASFKPDQSHGCANVSSATLKDMDKMALYKTTVKHNTMWIVRINLGMLCKSHFKPFRC